MIDEKYENFLRKENEELEKKLKDCEYALQLTKLGEKEYEAQWEKLGNKIEKIKNLIYSPEFIIPNLRKQFKEIIEND